MPVGPREGPQCATSHRLDVRRLQALRALAHFEFHLLVFGQGAETATVLDLGMVGKQILAAAIGGDETKALAVVEPLDGAGLHVAHEYVPKAKKEKQNLRRRGCAHADRDTQETSIREFKPGPDLLCEQVGTGSRPCGNGLVHVCAQQCNRNTAHCKADLRLIAR